VYEQQSVFQNLFSLVNYDDFCSGGWTISGMPLDLRDPRLLAIAEAERQFLEAEYDGYAASNANGAAFCRSVALIVRHNLEILFNELFVKSYICPPEIHLLEAMLFDT